MNHIADDLIDEYVLARLPETAAAALEEHLLICELCRDRLQLTEEFIQALRAASARRPRSMFVI